jgi:hypothetical protein
MKKILLSTIAISLFVFTSVNAQVTSGFKAGINFSDVNSLEFSNDGSSEANTIENQLEG